MIIHPAIRHMPHPDHPGWWTWDIDGPERFNAVLGQLLVRKEGEGRGICRMFPHAKHLNLGGVLHGGALMTFVDMALFAGGAMAGVTVAHAVTLDCSVQFLAPAGVGGPIDAEVELLRETKRLAFFRGRLLQNDALVAAFSATLRKMEQSA
jgi:uncharacterized protein (TIGR00369 family)